MAPFQAIHRWGAANEQPWTHLGKGRILGLRTGRGSGKALEAEVVKARLAEPALTAPTAVALGRLAVTRVAVVAVLIARPAERANGEPMAMALCTDLPLH